MTSFIPNYSFTSSSSRASIWRPATSSVGSASSCVALFLPSWLCEPCTYRSRLTCLQRLPHLRLIDRRRHPVWLSLFLLLLWLLFPLSSRLLVIRLFQGTFLAAREHSRRLWPQSPQQRLSAPLWRLPVLAQTARPASQVPRPLAPSSSLGSSYLGSLCHSWPLCPPRSPSPSIFLPSLSFFVLSPLPCAALPLPLPQVAPSTALEAGLPFRTPLSAGGPSPTCPGPRLGACCGR